MRLSLIDGVAEAGRLRLCDPDRIRRRDALRFPVPTGARQGSLRKIHSETGSMCRVVRTPRKGRSSLLRPAGRPSSSKQAPSGPCAGAESMPTFCKSTPSFSKSSPLPFSAFSRTCDGARGHFRKTLPSPLVLSSSRDPLSKRRAPQAARPRARGTRDEPDGALSTLKTSLFSSPGYVHGLFRSFCPKLTACQKPSPGSMRFVFRRQSARGANEATTRNGGPTGVAPTDARTRTNGRENRELRLRNRAFRSTEQGHSIARTGHSLARTGKGPGPDSDLNSDGENWRFEPIS